MYLAKKFPPSSKFEGTNKLFSIEEEKKKNENSYIFHNW